MKRGREVRHRQAGRAAADDRDVVGGREPWIGPNIA
jgi:hypothetical protein